MTKQQASKRSRNTRKQARFARMPRSTAHPSHLPATYTQADLDKFNRAARVHQVNRVMEIAMCDKATAVKWLEHFAETTPHQFKDFETGNLAINAIVKERREASGEHRQESES